MNFKTYSKSHKLKKRLHNAPENQRIFPDTQPTIIDEQVFARVQELRENKRRPAKQAERQGLFSGLLYCADCGSKLHFATGKNMTPQQDSIVGDKNIFSKDYMIISVPRFILIAPDGSIIDSNAPGVFCARRGGCRGRRACSFLGP